MFAKTTEYPKNGKNGTILPTAISREYGR